MRFIRRASKRLNRRLLSARAEAYETAAKITPTRVQAPKRRAARRNFGIRLPNQWTQEIEDSHGRRTPFLSVRDERDLVRAGNFYNAGESRDRRFDDFETA